jgi:hypothetical protein
MASAEAALAFLVAVGEGAFAREASERGGVGALSCERTSEKLSPARMRPGLRDFLQVSAGAAFFRSSRHWPRWFRALHKGAPLSSREILICYNFLQPQGPEARMVEKQYARSSARAVSRRCQGVSNR